MAETRKSQSPDRGKGERLNEEQREGDMRDTTVKRQQQSGAISYGGASWIISRGEERLGEGTILEKYGRRQQEEREREGQGWGVWAIRNGQGAGEFRRRGQRPHSSRDGKQDMRES